MDNLLKNTKTLIALAILLVIGAIIAIALRASSSRSFAESPTDIGPQPAPTSYVSNVGGYITDVESDTLTIEAPAFGTSTKPVVTTVAIGTDTSIFKEIPKDQAAYKKEQGSYIAKHDYSFPPPLPYTKTPLALSDLKPQMLVNIKLAEPTSEGATAHALEIGVLPIQPKYPTPSASQ